MAIVMRDKVMKELFSKPCVHTLKEYRLHLVLKQQNYFSQGSSWPFFRKIEEKLFWVIEAISKASATISIMNLSHTLYVIANAKVLYSILYSSGNIQIKSCWGTADHPLPSSVTLSWQKPQYPEG